MTAPASESRCRKRNAFVFSWGAVAYWMQRDQRVRDNDALALAQKTAFSRAAPLLVIFNVAPSFVGATWRQYDFMLRGLEETEVELRSLGIPFFVLEGDPAQAVSEFVSKRGIGGLFADYNPLRIVRRWKSDLDRRLEIPFVEVDAHNVVPVWELGGKREFAARTIRPKIANLLPEYLRETSQAIAMGQPLPDPVDWAAVRSRISADASVPPSSDFVPGPAAAFERLGAFVSARLRNYADDRNDPSVDGMSGLSPYLHFGQISAKRAALEVLRSEGVDEYVSDQVLSLCARAFLEELIVRRELAENFCHATENYDAFDAFPDWAKKTLDAHRIDARQTAYPFETFDRAATHDAIWNAAQREMARTGKMHGYLRMYWAKKILEWSVSPEEALATAIRLNDRYSLDGRDPNGYVGIAWSIGGLHDRPWFNRPVFGTVRYMAESGVRKKGDIDAYVAKFS